MVTRDDAARGKPAPDIFLRAAALLGVAPERCLAVEDSAHGVAAAHAAGMGVVMVATQAPAEVRQCCVDVVDRLDAVGRLLDLASICEHPRAAPAAEPSRTFIR